MNIKYTNSFQHNTDVCFVYHLGLFSGVTICVKSYNGVVEMENNTVGFIYSCWARRWCSLLLGLCEPQCYPETRWLMLALLSSVISPLFILDVAPVLPFVAGWLCVDILEHWSAGCCLPAVGLPGFVSALRSQKWGLSCAGNAAIFSPTFECLDLVWPCHRVASAVGKSCRLLLLDTLQLLAAGS